MKSTHILFVCFLAIISLSSCVTGNDDNLALQDLEAAFAQTPRVLNLTVDGVAPSRDQQSHWIDFEVSPGQTLSITADYDPGEGATSANFDFSRSYFHTAFDADDAKPVEPFTDRVTTIGGEVMTFDFSYTVPTTDDEGEAFQSGDHINLTWLSSNNLDGQGFNDINLIYQ